MYMQPFFVILKAEECKWAIW